VPPIPLPPNRSYNGTLPPLDESFTYFLRQFPTLGNY
jgi:hypothetical protein